MNRDLSYFDWLMSIVDISPTDSEYDVATLLSMIPYRWRFSLDRNWALRGLYLRREYQDLYGVVDEDMRQDDASVLEVLIGLSREFSDNTTTVSPPEAYREMICNLGITSGLSTNDVREIIFSWMNGAQDKSANPGPLPLRGYRGDARELDLTSLLNDYISINHPHDAGWLYE